jgi:hypothetical protein
MAGRPTMSPSYRSSPPCRWNVPRPRDARHMTHGRIEPLPMEPERGLIARLLRMGRG